MIKNKQFFKATNIFKIIIIIYNTQFFHINMESNKCIRTEKINNLSMQELFLQKLDIQEPILSHSNVNKGIDNNVEKKKQFIEAKIIFEHINTLNTWNTVTNNCRSTM